MTLRELLQDLAALAVRDPRLIDRTVVVLGPQLGRTCSVDNVHLEITDTDVLPDVTVQAD